MISFVHIESGQQRGYQIAVSLTNHLCYGRSVVNNNYEGWHIISYDIPTFYKNYADLTSLANALGGLGSLPAVSGITVPLDKVLQIDNSSMYEHIIMCRGNGGDVYLHAMVSGYGASNARNQLNKFGGSIQVFVNQDTNRRLYLKSYMEFDAHFLSLLVKPTLTMIDSLPQNVVELT